MIELIAVFGFAIAFALTVSSWHLDYGVFLIRPVQFYAGVVLGSVSLGLIHLALAIGWAVFWFMLLLQEVGRVL